MASAIDDLRYISRYGYQDPWAEATKTISNSLLAYGQSKLQRDTLIAQFKDKEEERQYDRERDLRNDSMDLIKGESPEVQLAMLRNENWSKNLPQAYVDTATPILENRVNYNTEMKSLYDTVIGDGTVDDKVLALNTAKKSFRPDDKYNPPRFTREATILTKQVDEANKSRLASTLTEQYYRKGILNPVQRNTILRETSADNKDLLLKDALKSERTEITDILDMYEGSVKAWEKSKEELALEDSWVTKRVEQLEKELTPYLDPEVVAMKRRDGSDYTFRDRVIIQMLGHKEQKRVKETGILKPFYEEYPYGKDASPAASNITEPGGGVTSLSRPTFSVDSNDRFALKVSDFAMPPESRVELEFENGSKQVLDGKTAYQLLKTRPDVKRTGQNSGIYLKIGVGTNPVLNKRSGSRIPGLIDDDSTMDVGIVYQNPSMGQYESFTGMRDTAFTTRNIKLKDNDLLIDVDTGNYHRVIIIPPPKRKALRFQSTYEEFKQALTTRPLDKTIFRVGGNDYNAQELIKKYMIPMSVPKESQTVQGERPSSTSILIGVTPVDTSRDSSWVADSTNWMNPAIK